MSLVSVVIPTFNAEEWLAETLRSVFAQTYRDLEIILIDDGSTDRTRKIAEEILTSSPFPHQILRQLNHGVSAARNAGCRVAQGCWIQFLDADDLLHPQKINLQVNWSREHRSADIVYSNWEKLILRSGSWQGEGLVRMPLIGQDVLADILKDENFQQLGSQLFRKAALDKVGGFNEAHSLIEDVELCIKMAAAGREFGKAPTQGPIFWYRDRPRSLSKLDERQFVEACIRNARLVQQFIREKPGCSPKAMEAIVEVFYSAARYFADRDWDRFEQLVEEIEAIRPSFVPNAPARLKLLSRLVGYRRAEQISGYYRKLKPRGSGFGATK
jgi:glycosyltransferase involved in cell wall biosynthesis